MADVSANKAENGSGEGVQRRSIGRHHANRCTDGCRANSRGAGDYGADRGETDDARSIAAADLLRAGRAGRVRGGAVVVPARGGVWDYPLHQIDAPAHYYFIRKILDEGGRRGHPLWPNDAYYPPLFHLLARGW